MKYTKWMICLATLIIALGSCKKKDGGTLSVEGSWRVIKAPKPDMRYIIFSSGEVSEVLREDTGSAAHQVYRNKYRLEGNVLLASVEGGSFYQYSIKTSGDTLWLISNVLNPSSSSTVQLIKDNGAPGPASWVKEITVSRLMNAVASGSLAFRAGKLLAAPSDQTLATVNFSNKTIESTVPTSNAMYAIDNFNSDVVFSDYDKMVRVNATTGATLAVSGTTGLGNSISAIAYDGLNSIWCFTYNSGGNNLFYYFDAVSGVFGPTRTTTMYIYDMAMKGGSLYGTDFEYIYKFNPASLKVEQTYHIDGHSIGGIATDGTDFYLHIFNATESLYVKTTLN